MECPRCHYDLFGIAIDRCPECGAKLNLRAVMLHHESAKERLEQQAERQLFWILLGLAVFGLLALFAAPLADLLASMLA
jgi:hypothetical protein